MQDKKLLNKRKGVYESFSSSRKSRMSFTLRVPWNLGKHGKIYHGITAFQHLIDPRQIALLKEPLEE